MPPSFKPGPRSACTVSGSCGRGNQSPHFWGARWSSISCAGVCHGSEVLGSEQLTRLPGSEGFDQPRPPPPQYTCCHHLSTDRRHSLSQQMMGLSERAPQLLRDCGEEGESTHARLWFLPTVLLLASGQARSLSHTAL